MPGMFMRSCVQCILNCKCDWDLEVSTSCTFLKTLAYSDKEFQKPIYHGDKLSVLYCDVTETKQQKQTSLSDASKSKFYSFTLVNFFASASVTS